jgi:hypothetical protein
MVQSRSLRRGAIELLLLVSLGLLMAVLGPYGTLDVPPAPRTVYWLLAIVGGGLIGIAVDQALGKRIEGFWKRVVAVTVTMTPPVTLLVYGLNLWLLDAPAGARWLPILAWRVFVIAFLVMAMRALAWRRVVETRTLVMPPMPDAERVFRMRLSARRRTARLIALAAEDHYVRVHTDAGSELISMRFADALAELVQAHGFRVHRSWWVAAGAIEGLRWCRGRGEARLEGGLVAPVSRNYATVLRQAGWH